MPIDRTWRVWSAAIALAFNAGAASAQGVDVAKLIPDAAEVVRAKIVLTPAGRYFRAPLTETRLLAFGCNVTENSQQVAALVDVLRSSLQSDDGEVTRFSLRNAVFLKLRNGATVKYTFGGAEHRNQRIIHGWADNGMTGGGTWFFSHSSLLPALESWARDDAVEKKDGDWCVANR